MTVVDDLIVMGDAKLERVREASSRRVYALRFTSNGKGTDSVGLGRALSRRKRRQGLAAARGVRSADMKLLFWMQEPSDARDAELVTLFNKHAGGGLEEGELSASPSSQGEQHLQPSRAEATRKANANSSALENE